MKNKTGLFGIIALTAVIGFSTTACRQPGTVPTVDRAALGSAIAGAQTLLAGTATSTDGTGVASGYWAPLAAIDTFTATIAAAQAVHAGNASTQAMVDAAVEALATAQAAFIAARQPGTYTPTPVDRTALAQALTAAQTLLAQTETSADGTDIPPTAYWTTATVRATLDNAVNTARNVHDNTAATQAEVDAATATLETAQTTFNTARLPGTFTPRGNFEIDFSPGMATNVQGPTVYLSYAGQPPAITLLNPDRFDTGSIRWLLGNGDPVPAAALSDSGATLILNRYVHGNRTGEHRVTVKAGIGGVPHGAVVDFTVEL